MQNKKELTCKEEAIDQQRGGENQLTLFKKLIS